MLFIPKKQKYKKQQKGKSFQKVVSNYSSVKYGQVGLKVLHPTRFNSKQIIMLYNNLKKKMKKKGKVLITIFPQTPITKKPVEVRMGKGKGNVDFWVAKVKAGRIICEISTFKISYALKVLNNLRYRLPVKTKAVIRKQF
jgi:large subunit ribosomal protein L16